MNTGGIFSDTLKSNSPGGKNTMPPPAEDAASTAACMASLDSVPEFALAPIFYVEDRKFISFDFLL
ncbi:MAG TPA: hypothetical protein P5270_09800 [Victivallales bacterium]|nr:hypothetical protein [Victivallales bacterium]